jgi:cytochrome bd ubiquinol oxidase subunit I
MGIMLYGEGRVSQRVMFFATLMVSVGTLLSTTWILAANSWMQTPAGYKLVHGQYEATNWLHAIFNPSFGWRYPHLVVGVLISASWMLVGISAWYLVKRRHLDLARRTVSIGLGTLVVLMPIQIYVGDQLAGFMGVHQPPKLQALEGNWDSDNSGYQIFIVPLQDQQRNAFRPVGARWGGGFGPSAMRSGSGAADIFPTLRRP